MAIPRNLANLAPKLSATGGSFASTLGVGGATPSASGAGITFPANEATSASSDANTLDDYEEGTWSPTLRDGTTTTYTTQLGTYTKIGRLVYANFDITINSVGNGSVFVISGLPFTHGSSFPSGGAVYLFNSIATNAVFLTTYISNGESTIRIGQVSAAASSTSQGDVFQNGTNIRGFVLIIV